MNETVSILMIIGLLPLAVIAGVVAAVVAARREAERDEPPADEGIGSVRRLFIYLLALVGVVLAAIGVAMIIGGAIDAANGQALILDRRRSLAVALAFAVVGTPAWLLFMLLAQRSVHAHEVERRSQARRLYLGVTRSVVLAVVTWNAIAAGHMLLGTAPLEGGAWGALAAWGGVWAIHQRIAAAEPAPTVITRLIDRLAMYFGALLGLLLLLSGAIEVIAVPLSEVYDRALRGTIVSSGWDRGLREALVTCVVGGAIWGGYWLRALRLGDRLTTLWRVQVFLFGALLGVALAIVPAATMLYTALQWAVGVPDAESAVAQFAGLPGAFAAFVIGVAAWGYHRAVLTEAGDAHERSGPERVFRYLLSAAGLFTTAIGTTTLIALAAEGFAGGQAEYLVTGGWWRNPLLRGLTEIVVGAPIWARYWSATQQTLAAGPEERGAPSRRVYVFAAVGLSVLALLVSLTIVLFRLFEAALAGDLSLVLLRDSSGSLGVALTAGTIAYYHLLVLREDQAAAPPAESAPPSEAPPASGASAAGAAGAAREIVLLAAGDARALIADLERIDGVSVRSWRRQDGGAAPALSAERVVALHRAIDGAGAGPLLVIVDGDDFQALPYTPDSRPGTGGTGGTDTGADR